MKRELLVMQNLTISSVGQKHLDGFHLRINEGEFIHILGTSNAGKTMLYHYFVGDVIPKSGVVKYRGQVYGPGEAFGGTKEVICIRENSSLIEGLSIAENICVITGKRKIKFLINKKTMNFRIDLLLKQYARELKADMKIQSLTLRQRHIVELLRAMENEIPLIFIDDAFRNYGIQDMSEIQRILQVLKEKGITILYASRKNDCISQWAERKIIMRHGRNVKTFYKEDYDERQCRRWLTGTDRIAVFVRQKVKTEEVCFMAENIKGESYISNCTMEIHQGEIVGFYDMNNRANYELADMILGKKQIEDGRMQFDKKEYQPEKLEDALVAHIGYIPREHIGSGIVETMTFAENLMLPIMSKMSVFSIFRNNRVYRYLEKEYLHVCGVEAKNRKIKMSELNSYQRVSVVFHKWILTRPKMIVCEEICEELDIEMRRITYSAVSELAGNGTAVIIVSQNLGELVSICDTVYVMNTWQQGVRNEEIKIYKR